MSRFFLGLVDESFRAARLHLVTVGKGGACGDNLKFDTGRFRLSEY